MTSPSPENLNTLFEFVQKGFKRLNYQVCCCCFFLSCFLSFFVSYWLRTLPLVPCLSVGSNFLLILRCFFFKCLQIQSDYEIEKSHEPDHKDAVVRINIFNKDHRQTIQYIDPSEATRVANAELGLLPLVLLCNLIVTTLPSIVCCTKICIALLVKLNFSSIRIIGTCTVCLDSQFQVFQLR